MDSNQEQHPPQHLISHNGQQPLALYLSPSVQRPPQKKRTRLTWTGFSHRTLWDWLGLLFVPLILAVATIWFNVQLSELQTTTTLQQSQLSSQQSIQQASDQQQEATLQAYLDRMAGLIENGKLADPHSSTAIRALATAQTLTALRRLDAKRRGALLQFIHDAGLIYSPDPIISLDGAYLGDTGLTFADLHDADLHNTNLNLADLRVANLSGADLSHAGLFNANLSYAYLSGAHIDQQQLAQALSLRGATLPDGSLHP